MAYCLRDEAGSVVARRSIDGSMDASMQRIKLFSGPGTFWAVLGGPMVRAMMLGACFAVHTAISQATNGDRNGFS